jgi:hypothetical protein
MTVADLPALNASLNALSALLLAGGYVFIRKRQIARHRFCMLSAFAVSTAFLVSYVVYHAEHGSTAFPGHGWIRPAYFLLLVSHVLLAVGRVPNTDDLGLEKAGLTTDDIACVIPHQANLRIIEAIADRLKIPLDRFFVNLDKYGNTSAAAVAMALDEANRTGRIKHGDYVLMVVFGGGLTWASTVVEW